VPLLVNAAMLLFPPPPPLPHGDVPHPVDRLLDGSTEAAALAFGLARVLRVAKRKEAR
jgi:hypothetical protein